MSSTSSCKLSINQRESSKTSEPSLEMFGGGGTAAAILAGTAIITRHPRTVRAMLKRCIGYLPLTVRLCSIGWVSAHACLTAHRRVDRVAFLLQYPPTIA